MRHYLDYDEFYDKLVNHLPEGETWRLYCEDVDDRYVFSLVFAKHVFEAEDGNMYEFIVYSYPRTLDAGLINEDVNDGWEPGICDTWFDITETCNLKPFIEEE